MDEIAWAYRYSSRNEQEHRRRLTEILRIDASKAQAAKAARTAIMRRARAYLMYPEYLDWLRPGFEASTMTPGQLIWFATELLQAETRLSPALSVPVKTISAKAAILAARYRRPKAHQLNFGRVA